MKTAKKLLSVVLTLCMMLSLLPATALADTPTINFTVSDSSGPAAPYGSLADAIGGAKGGDTITLSSGDLNLTEAVTIDKNLTLDLNTHTLNLSSAATVVTVVAGGSLTVTNGVLNVTATGGEAALTVDGGTLTLGANDASDPKIHVTGVNMGLTVKNGGKATLTSVETTGDNCTGVQATVGENATVVVKGNVTVSGENSYGVEVSGELNSVTVEGNISATGIGCFGANASDHGAVTIQRDVGVDGAGGVCNSGLRASGGGSVAVNGNVTVSSVSGGQIFCGAVASGVDSVVTVKGNITVTGDAGVGVMAGWGGTITVNGNVSAYIGAQTYADAGENSLITINGDIFAATDYIRIDSVSKNVSAGVIGTDENSGYLVYTDPTVDGTQTVRVKAPVMNTKTGVYYPSLTDALIAAADGETIKLLKNITESVTYTNTGKTIAIDGNNKTITSKTGDSIDALVLFGSGTIKLKNLTLQGGAATEQSVGLEVTGSINVQSEGTVIANGGAVAPNSYPDEVNISIGLQVSSSGTVNITEANGGTAAVSTGVLINSAGTVNVSTATGEMGTEFSVGVQNASSGTVNVNHAIGNASDSTCSGYGVANNSGTVNVTTATGTDCGVFNVGVGTVNVTTAAGKKGVHNGSSQGTVNVFTAIGGTPATDIDNEGGGTLNSGENTAVLTLNKGTGTSCVLDSITVAASGETTVGSLPSVYKNNTYNNTWYTDSAKTNAFSGTTVTGAATLYSDYYTADVKISTAAIAGVTAPVRGAAPVISLAETSEYTAAIAWSPVVNGTFAASTAYTATITLTPKMGYTTTGVAANFFTVAGATATNSADSGIITAIFPATAAADSGSPTTGGGGDSATTTPTITVSGTTATTTVTPTISGSVATGSVTADQMSDALKKAQAAAGASGTPKVAIQISGAAGASSVGMTIPHASLQSLVSGGVGALTVSGPTGSVSFDAAALKTISDASGDVNVTIAKTDGSTLSDAVRALVGSHPVFTFSVTSGGSAISQFGGDVTVSVSYTLAAGEDPNAIVIYYIAADGTPTPIQDARYDTATGTVIFTTTHFSTYAVGYNKVSFTDVASGAWYHDAVTFLAARGITSGTTATTFGPDATLTRGQFITMLLRAYGVAAVTNPTDNFSDAGSTYYTGYLAAAKKLGITTGVGNNKFAPDQAITRQEMFTLLYNALKAFDKLPSGTSGKALADFTDAGSVASWAADAMTALVKAGTVSGSNSKLNPTGTTTRAEMAQVLYNLLGK